MDPFSCHSVAEFCLGSVCGHVSLPGTLAIFPAWTNAFNSQLQPEWGATGNT